MIITTATFVPNMSILDTKDVIFSEQVVSVNIAKDIANGIKGLFGGALEGYNEEYKKAREKAIADLTAQAENLNGNAIINLQISYNQFVNSDMFCIVATANGIVADVAPLIEEK